MEKIQVELNTIDNLDTEDVEPCKFYFCMNNVFVPEFERVTEPFRVQLPSVSLESLFSLILFINLIYKRIPQIFHRNVVEKPFKIKIPK